MSFNSLNEVEALFSEFGVNVLYIKLLALKQDNDKNQIYFGSGGVFNLLPCKVVPSSRSESKEKENQIKASQN